jgi:hypothetical protein
LNEHWRIGGGGGNRTDRPFAPFGVFKGLRHEEAGDKLGGWCRRRGIAAELEIGNVRHMDVVFVILRED